jgi:hypothetical protein
MNASTSIDWITASTAQLREPNEVLPAAQWGKVEHGILHYQCQKICSDSAARFLWSPDIAGRGSCCILGGSALAFFRTFAQLAPDTLIPHLSRLGFLATRIDCALDLYESKLSVRQIYDQIMSGAISVPTRKITLITAHAGSMTGETLYCGSRESERYLRIYDKGLEQNSALPGEWIRIELEIKGKRAKSAWQMALDTNEATLVASELSAFVTTQQQWWELALAGQYALPLSMHSRPISSRRKWLLGQVSMALANELREDPHFWETLRVSVDDLVINSRM